MILSIENASCGYPGRTVLQDVSIQIQSGEIVCLLGPNGAGKTTLFKSMLGFLPLLAGTVRIDGEDIRSWPRSRLAKHIGYVPQSHTPPVPYPVHEVVAMGRAAYLGLFAQPSRADEEIADLCMERLGIEQLRNRPYTEISGGECQLVLIARALAQNPGVLVMDEPTANLDFGNQVRVLRQVRELSESGMAILMTTHFPDQAFLCASRVCLLLRDGTMYTGTTGEVMTEENLRQAYGTDVRILEKEDREAGRLVSCVPIMK